MHAIANPDQPGVPLRSSSELAIRHSHFPSAALSACGTHRQAVEPRRVGALGRNLQSAIRALKSSEAWRLAQGFKEPLSVQQGSPFNASTLQRFNGAKGHSSRGKSRPDTQCAAFAPCAEPRPNRGMMSICGTDPFPFKIRERVPMSFDGAFRIRKLRTRWLL